MTDSSRLFIIDGVIHGLNQPEPAKDFDILMLGLFEGKHRTKEDFNRIFKETDFKLKKLTPTNFGVGILEIEPR